MPFEIINPISKGILEVADKDFPNEMNWDDAMIACASLGNGWRLPSIEELEAMHEQLHMVDMGNFKTNNCYLGVTLLGLYTLVIKSGNFSLLKSNDSRLLTSQENTPLFVLAYTLTGAKESSKPSQPIPLKQR